MKTTLKQKVVKTTNVKQNLWCYMSKQETVSGGPGHLLLENCTVHGGVDGDGSLYCCLEKYSS